MTDGPPADELLNALGDALGDGFVEAGARGQPQFDEMPRWVRVANVPDGAMPPIPALHTRRTWS